ncbi:hypothetical protein MTO96_008558 [Rhipicephalus appendiculatus]
MRYPPSWKGLVTRTKTGRRYPSTLPPGTDGTDPQQALLAFASHLSRAYRIAFDLRQARFDELDAQRLASIASKTTNRRPAEAWAARNPIRVLEALLPSAPDFKTQNRQRAHPEETALGFPGGMNEYASLAVVTLLFLVGALCSEWDCNVTLPWSVENSDHPVIPRRVLQDLLRCPHELHGCTPAPVLCDEQLFAVTCSCAKNCELYGDCCWDAGPNLSSITPATCVARNVDHHFGRNFYVISVCNPKWPEDGVRQSCENATNSNEAFYSIPVTTKKMVTYLNAFCALCNYDLDDTATFWNSTGKPESGFQVDVPPFVLKHVDTFLRPCDPHLVNVFKCPEGADSELARKCNTYFAPVEHIDNISDVVYKNVYCGLCNGAEISSLKCIPKRAVRETWVRVHIKQSFRPNLVSLMRPVLTQDSCFSWHDDKCYIKVPEYYYTNHSIGDGSDDDIDVPNRTRIVAYNVQNYLTLICIGLSLACLFLKVVVYVFFKTSRSFSTRCTLCLSCTLFWSHLSFLLANSFDVHTVVCVVFAIVLHYGFLSTFFWTSLLSFDIWKHVASARISTSKRSGFLLYSVIAWGVPLLIVGTSVAINWAAPDFVLSPRYGRFGCWIGNLWSQLGVFSHAHDDPPGAGRRSVRAHRRKDSPNSETCVHIRIHRWQ